jgi:hypothetical protein
MVHPTVRHTYFLLLLTPGPISRINTPTCQLHPHRLWHEYGVGHVGLCVLCVCELYITILDFGRRGAAVAAGCQVAE